MNNINVKIEHPGAFEISEGNNSFTFASENIGVIAMHKMVVKEPIVKDLLGGAIRFTRPEDVEMFAVAVELSTGQKLQWVFEMEHQAHMFHNQIHGAYLDWLKEREEKSGFNRDVHLKNLRNTIKTCDHNHEKEKSVYKHDFKIQDGPEAKTTEG